MTTQIIANPSSKRISDLYRRIKEATLILQPEFQRKFVWNNAHKEKFIETILLGLPFPEIYVAQQGINLDKLEAQEVIVDGQQRLSTIAQYIDGDEADNFCKKIKKFKYLTDEEKTDFLNYSVVVRDLGDIGPEKIKEIFKRINLTQYSLEQVEIHNAIYDGEFINTAKLILENVSLHELPTFNDQEILRMADLYFVLLIMSTIENGGYFTRDYEIEKCIIRFNNQYGNKNIAERFGSVISNIRKMKLKPDSIWYRKSNFFTLVVELFGVLDTTDFKKLKVQLENFESRIIESKDSDKTNNDYARYYSYMYTGTNNRQARVVRADLFKRYVIKESQKSKD